jgi:hypothetical protein
MTDLLRHQPALARRNDGGWGVYCLACSDEAQEYVYPCAVHEWKGWPPPVLYERSAPRAPENYDDEEVITP